MVHVFFYYFYYCSHKYRISRIYKRAQKVHISIYRVRIKKQKIDQPLLDHVVEYMLLSWEKIFKNIINSTQKYFEILKVLLITSKNIMCPTH